MQTNQKNKENLVKVPEKELLSLVASKLKNKTLFPEKIEQTKEYLKKVTEVKL